MDTRAVLFDLDDTLYQYAPCNDRALRAVHRHLDGAAPVSWAEFTRMHDLIRRDLAQRLGGQAAAHNRVLLFKELVEGLTGRCQPSLVGDLYRLYWQTFLAAIRPHPDAHRVLDTLSAVYDLALISNHTALPQLDKLQALGLAAHFPVVVTSEEAGCEKPAAAVFALALQRLGVAANRAVMVGDNPTGDIAGAARLGLRTIYTVEYTGATTPCVEATFTIDRLAALLDILRADP